MGYSRSIRQRRTLGTRREDIGPSFPSSRHRGDADAMGVLLDLGESVSYMDERANPLRNLTLPRRRGGSQGRGLPARSRLIGGRGLSTNPRPALCFSHHPWRVSRVSNLKSGSLNAHEILVCFIEGEKNQKIRLLHEF